MWQKSAKRKVIYDESDNDDGKNTSNSMGGNADAKVTGSKDGEGSPISRGEKTNVCLD